MTLPVPCPQSSSSDPLTSTPRKRRRRTPAGGAADDCFACVKRNTKCDRRRPYCSQCLEVGKECSGYRTHLTWGVGVASRGKLRGLSLPVAKSAPAPRSPTQSVRPRSASNVLPREASSEDEVQAKNEASSLPVTPMRQPGHALSAYDVHGMAINNTDITRMPDWNLGYSPTYRTQEPHTQLQHHFQPQIPRQPQNQIPQQPQQQQSWLNQPRPIPSSQQYPAYSTDRSQAMAASTSFGSVRSFPESDYTNSPLSQSFHQDDMSYQQSPLPMYNSYSSTSSSMQHSPHPGMMMDRRAPTSQPGPYYAPSDVSSSMQSQGFYDMSNMRSNHPNPSAPGGMFYDDDSLS